LNGAFGADMMVAGWLSTILVVRRLGAETMQGTARHERYREILQSFKPDDGDLLGALHAVQEEFGWVSREGVDAVARRLHLSASQVFGAVSFYTEFRMSAPARLTVHWCSGPACRLKGGDNIRRAIEMVLGFGMEDRSPDGRIGLHVQQCDGCCERAPLVWLQRPDDHGDGPFAPLQAHRGEVVGPLRVADAIALARELASGQQGS
jgi:NADH:ubiquinone oxidoreductase subunit E